VADDLTHNSSPRLGLLWRGDRSADPYSTPGAVRLEPLMSALRERNAVVEPVVYEDDAREEIRAQLLHLDGVLVWVNPIQDGANRALLDELLREVSGKGVWVSADPAVILKLGTKEVLFQTRDIGWGSDTELYRDPADFRTRFPKSLARDGVRVLKQARGNGGNGVWSVALVEPTTTSEVPSPDAPVIVRHALDRANAVPEIIGLGEFFERCDSYFEWSGCLVDQAFQSRLADGLVRCYFVHDQVVGFCHQWPKGLLDPSAAAIQPPDQEAVFQGPETPTYQSLRHSAEHDWVPSMKTVLALDTLSLPAIWDADFLYGPRTLDGENTYVLCEINVSAVWPFPEYAIAPLAKAAVAKATAAQTRKS